MPAAVMKRAHHEKLRLCEALEGLADSLPGQVDHLKCIGVASTLVPLLRSVHQYEEEIIYPAYEPAVGGAAGHLSFGSGIHFCVASILSCLPLLTSYTCRLPV